MTKELISEVELNQHFLRVDDVLIYVDSSWSGRYTITEVFDSGVLLKDSEGEEDFYFFSEFQIGWYISEKTKELNRLNFRTNYLQ